MIPQAFWQRVSELDTAFTPSFSQFRSQSVHWIHFVIPFLWAVVSSIVVLGTTLLIPLIIYPLGLSIPFLYQFLWPSSNVVIYLWTLHIFAIPLPLHLSLFLFPLLALSLWLYVPPPQSDSSTPVQYFAFLSGYANLVLAITFMLFNHYPSPGIITVTYNSLFAGLNTGLQLVNLTYFFSHTLNSFAVPLLILCMLSVLHGARAFHDVLGFLVGIITAVAAFYHLMPHDLRSISSSSSSSSSLESGTRKIPGPSSSSSHETLVPVLVIPIPRQPSQSSSTPDNSVPVSESIFPSPQPANPPPPPPPPPQLVDHQENISETGLAMDAHSATIVDLAQHQPRRRLSVVGPREPRHRSRPASVDFRSSRRLPTPPGSNPPSIRGGGGGGGLATHRVSMPSSSYVSKSHSAPEPQARWSDNLFELQERLGESSSRITFKVREKRSGSLYVRKTFYSRQTSGTHIIRHLFDLIARQQQSSSSSSDGPSLDAIGGGGGAFQGSVNVVRCYGAYFPEVEPNDGVRGIFEFCEGGSLHSISTVITQRGAIVGEKIAGRIASGMLQGLDFLHGLDMVHFNVRPSNVFITQSGIVKLSEPEIPGEGAVALTDRFLKAVNYASPERITGNPVNPSKSDVWSLGITLLEFVQNRYPYPELPTVELMMQIVQGEAPCLQDGTNATYGPRMKKFFTQCLFKDEIRRPTAQELLGSPWVLGVANQNVRMDRWIREVWSW